MTWTKTVESKELREHFNSFTVEFDNYETSCSFVCKIFENDFKKELETEIKSLAQEVVLTKKFQKTDSLQPMETAVYEVAVTFNNNKLCVTEKVIFPKLRYFFFYLQRCCFSQN